jgi:RNA 2',3'-cyclic 3'-phosphodiesterase
VRLTADDQLHLTLHFLGPADEHQVIGALAKATIGRVSVSVDGVGHFVGRGGSVTLWARVAPNRELNDLQERIARSLHPIGYQSEDRLFTPHISLARC